MEGMEEKSSSHCGSLKKEGRSGRKWEGTGRREEEGEGRL